MKNFIADTWKELTDRLLESKSEWRNARPELIANARRMHFASCILLAGEIMKYLAENPTKTIDDASAELDREIVETMEEMKHDAAANENKPH